MTDEDHADDFDVLLDSYDKVDRFVTVMNSISPLVEQSVTIYQELEDLVFSKIDLEEQLKDGARVQTSYIDTCDQITLRIEELSELIEGVRSFTKMI